MPSVGCFDGFASRGQKSYNKCVKKKAYIETTVVEEVRRIRCAYAKQFGYDLRAMVADLHRKEKAHPDRLVSFDPKPVRRLKTAYRTPLDQIRFTPSGPPHLRRSTEA